MRIAARGLQLGGLRDYKAETGHAFDTFIGRGDKSCASKLGGVQRKRPESRHRINQQFAPRAAGCFGNFFDRV